jgi:hypothetical protein
VVDKPAQAEDHDENDLIAARAAAALVAAAVFVSATVCA